MSEFSAEWLDLRETADARARNRDLANALDAHFALRSELRVVDLGSGTGSNLRAVAPLLPGRQRWTLFDHDPKLHEAARPRLKAWADAIEDDGPLLRLKKGAQSIEVSFEKVDLAHELGAIFAANPDLVAASALFDLTSKEYMRKLMHAVAMHKTVLYATLLYNGLQRFTPHRPADNRIIAAFHQHQMRDKGFGPAAGPTAAAYLADQLRLNGLAVLEGESPWQLKGGDQMLIDELVRGNAVAAADTGSVDQKMIVDWVNVRRTAALVGHTDVLAVPGT